MIENLLINYNQRKKLFLYFLGIFVFFYLVAVYTIYIFNKNNFYTNIDNTLKSTAYGIDQIVAEDFHDRAVDKESIGLKEDKENIEKLSKFVKNSDIEYIYSMVQKDGNIYFTSSSATSDDIIKNQVTYYFDSYESATDLLKNVLKTNKITFEESTDKWGTFRTIFIPMTTTNGNRYILGADVKIDFINDKLNHIIELSLVLFLIFTISSYILFIIIKKIDQKELNFIQTIEKNLKKEISTKTKELAELNNSLEIKIKEKTKQLAELNKSLENKVQQEVEKNLKNELKILEQSKLASMGEMIGNIAHQWRQPLSVISTVSSGLQIKKDYGMLSDEEFIEDTNIINKNVDFLSETIDTFRNFLKEDKVLKEVVVQDRIDTAINLTKITLDKHGIQLINNIDYKTPYKIKLVVGEITQVLINLINNAKDILVEKSIKGSWIKIDLQKVKDKITISIEDNGGGIPSDIIDKIFEPYFTTKHKSQGTGLGLYMSHKIVTESLKGDLYVENTKDGAKFYIDIFTQTTDI